MKIRVVSTITGKKEKLHFGDQWVLTGKGKLRLAVLSEGEYVLTKPLLKKGEYSVQFAFYRDALSGKWAYEQEVFY